MSEVITIYTPGTGLPDLEIKIAYGLARVAIEASTNVEVKLIPRNGYFQLDLPNKPHDAFNKTFSMLAQRLLSSDRFYNLGVSPKYKKNYPFDKTKNRIKDKSLVELYSHYPDANYTFDKEKACKHQDLPVFGSSKRQKQIGGLILLCSFHAGKPQKRDKRETDLNLGLCEICGYMAVLGNASFSFIINLGKGRNRKYVSVLPIPSERATNDDLVQLLSIQKILNDSWLSELIPLKVFSLGLLSKFPSLSETVKKLNLYFHLSHLSKGRNGTVVEQTQIVNTLSYTDFINDSTFNIVTVETLLHGQPKIGSLNELEFVLQTKKKRALCNFARSYVQDTSTKDWTNFLYLRTAKYLLKEVVMIKPEIIKNKALGSLARTLRYFIREKKYGYADNIRNAKEASNDFGETLAKMLRESELRRLQQKQDKEVKKQTKNYIHIPNEEEIKELFQLASDENFDEVKTALVILAFSFPSKADINKNAEI